MQYIEEFLNYLKLDLNYSDNTILSYKNDLTKFKTYFSNKDLLDISIKDINNYLNILSDYAPSTVAHNISSLKSFYTFYVKLGNIKVSPVQEVSSPKIGLHLPVYLTEEEINKILDINVLNAYDARNKAILELMYATGIRISELVSLEFKNLDLEDGIIRVLGKGSKERIIPINDTCIDAINDYINNYRSSLIKKNINNYLFLNNHGNMMSRQGIFKMIKKYAEDNRINKNIHPHTFRHTFATHLLEHGADLRIIQELLGHSDISTTQIYTHISNQKLKSDYLEYFPRK